MCYDHLAGELGPLVHDSLVQRRMLRVGRNGLELTDAGAALLARFVEIGWASRLRRSRVLSFSAAGERALRRQFPIALR